MCNLVRILLVIACIAALYYLVVVLARSVREEDFGRRGPGAGVEFAPAGVPDAPWLRRVAVAA